MKDIAGFKETDLSLSDTEVYRAKNLLDVQEGNLHYLPLWGIDLKFFLTPDFEIQNVSFDSYVVQKIAQWRMNPTRVVSKNQNLARNVRFLFGADSAPKTLIRG